MRTASRWFDLIEERAYTRLRQLRQRGLWDGQPPVPVDFVLEHILDLRLSWEMIDEEPHEMILACLRPSSREVVLNERHRARFEAQPGLERFSLAHEAGHADVFALAGESSQFSLIAGSYSPQRRSATKGPVFTLAARMRDLSRELRTEVMRELVVRERARRERGEDSPMERRAVDHYAAVLLMPADLVRRAAVGRYLADWRTLGDLSRQFAVSVSAMRIRLEELGLIFGVDENGAILLTDPSRADQGSLF